MLRIKYQRLILQSRSISHSAYLLRQAIYDYNKVKNIPKNTLLIDVREPDEYAAGAIPGAKNLPLSSLEKTLKLSADAFKQQIGYSKPDKSQEIVFYCKAGVRSTNASNIAEQLGYSEIGNYKGSWNDWTTQSQNPNQADGTGDGAKGGIDLKAMNQKEEARAQPGKDAEKQGKPLQPAHAPESESVQSGAQMSDNKKFQ